MKTKMKLGTFLGQIVLCLCLGFVSAQAQSIQKIASQPISNLEFDQVPLHLAIDFLRGKSQELDPSGRGMNFIIEPNVDQERPVTLQLRNVPLGVAIGYTTEQGFADYKIDRFGVRIVSRDLTKPRKSTSPSAELARKARSLQLDQFEVQEGGLAATLRFLAQKSAELDPKGDGINFVLSPRVDSEIPVSLKLADVPLTTAISQLTKSTQLSLRVDRWAIVIEPPYHPPVNQLLPKASPKVASRNNRKPSRKVGPLESDR